MDEDKFAELADMVATRAEALSRQVRQEINIIIFPKEADGDIYVFLYTDECRCQTARTFGDFAKRYPELSFTWTDAGYWSQRIRDDMERQDREDWYLVDEHIQDGFGTPPTEDC